MKLLLASLQADELIPRIRSLAQQEQVAVVADAGDLGRQVDDPAADGDVLLLVADLRAPCSRVTFLIDDFAERRTDVLRIGLARTIDDGVRGLINRGLLHGCWSEGLAPDEVIDALRRAMAHRERARHDEQWLQCLEQRVTHQIRHADRAFDDMIAALVMALDIRENESAFHSRRVALQCLYFALDAGVEADSLEDIYLGALLHDVGKIGITDAILLKRGALTPEERDVMQTHVRIGVKLLSEVGRFLTALDIPRCHHERVDGSGYPQRLKWESIPLPARLFAIVDVYDALRGERPYKPPKGHAECIAVLRDASGTHFDSELLDIFCAIDPEVLDDLAKTASTIHVFQQAMLACRRAHHPIPECDDRLDADAPLASTPVMRLDPMHHA